MEEILEQITGLEAQTEQQQALLESYMKALMKIAWRFNNWMTFIEILEITAVVLWVGALVYLVIQSRPKKVRKKGGRHG